MSSGNEAQSFPIEFVESILDRMSIVSRIRALGVSKSIRNLILARMDRLVLDEDSVLAELRLLGLEIEFPDFLLHILRRYGQRVSQLVIKCHHSGEKIGQDPAALPGLCPNLEVLELRIEDFQGTLGARWSTSADRLKSSVFLDSSRLLCNVTGFVHTEGVVQCRQILTRIRQMKRFCWLNLPSEELVTCLILDIGHNGPIPALEGVRLMWLKFNSLTRPVELEGVRILTQTLRHLEVHVPVTHLQMDELSQFSNLSSFHLTLFPGAASEGGDQLELKFLASYKKLKCLKIWGGLTVILTDKCIQHLPASAPLEEICLDLYADKTLLEMMTLREYKLKSISMSLVPTGDSENHHLSNLMNNCEKILKKICLPVEIGDIFAKLSDHLIGNLGELVFCAPATFMEQEKLLSMDPTAAAARQFIKRRADLIDGISGLNKPILTPCRLLIAETAGVLRCDWEELMQMAKPVDVFMTVVHRERSKGPMQLFRNAGGGSDPNLNQWGGGDHDHLEF